MISAQEALKKAERSISYEELLNDISKKISEAAENGKTSINIEKAYDGKNNYFLNMPSKDNKPDVRTSKIIDELKKKGFNVTFVPRHYITVNWGPADNAEENTDNGDLYNNLKKLNAELRANSEEYRKLDDALSDYLKDEGISGSISDLMKIIFGII